LGPVIPQL
jgi:hypothetical protein